MNGMTVRPETTEKVLREWRKRLGEAEARFAEAVAELRAAGVSQDPVDEVEAAADSWASWARLVARVESTGDALGSMGVQPTDLWPDEKGSD